MVEFASLPQGVAHKGIAVYAAIVALGGALGGYAIHEHHAAQNLTADNVQTTAALNATRHELSDLTAKVNMLASRSETQAAPSTPSTKGRARPNPLGSSSAEGGSALQETAIANRRTGQRD